MTYHRSYGKSNTTSAISESGTAWPSKALEFMGWILSFLSSVFLTIVCLFVKFHMAIVLSVLQSAVSDYLFGIFKLSFLLWGNPCIKSASFKITNQSAVKGAQFVPIIILHFWCKHGHQSKGMHCRSKSHGFWKWPFFCVFFGRIRVVYHYYHKF